MRRTTLAAAVTATLVLGASCVGDPGPAWRPASSVVPESRFAALWPEQTLVATMQTQRAVDGGDDDLAWRTDAADVASRFAARVLGWERSRIAEHEAWHLGSGIEIARVWLCDEDGCPSTGAAFDQEVILKRLAGAGDSGVWSVTDVTSGRLFLDEGPQIRIRDPFVRAGRRLHAIAFGGALPDGTKVVAGSTTIGPCGPFAETATPTIRFSRVRFQVGAVLDRRCAKVTRPAETAGYVFVYPLLRGVAFTPATLFTEPRPEGSRPLMDLTAMAVRFTPRAEVPKPPGAWLSRDPATLPACSPDRLRLAVGAGNPLPGFGVGVFAEVRRARGAPCHATLDLTLTLFDADGRRVRILGERVQRVDGYLPGYEPRQRALHAGWGLYEWCGRSETGPLIARIRSGTLIGGVASWQLVRWCSHEDGTPRLEVLELDPTP